MEHDVRVRVVGAAAVVALGLVTSLVTTAVVASRAYEARGRETARANREITVKGSARIRVRSDVASWAVHVRGEAPTLDAAFERLEAGVASVRGFLEARGFRPASVRLGAVERTAHHARDKDGRETRTVEGYTVARAFTVSDADVDRYAAAAVDVTELLKAGVLLHSYAPEFRFSKAADLKVRLLGEASSDARARAQEIASKTGCRVAEVRHAQMSPIQIVEPDSSDVSSVGTYDTSTVDKDVYVVVTVTFGIQT
jgi:hypothetical protein